MEQGLCKAIGISNFTIKKTKDLLETAKIVPACNQGMYKLCNLMNLQPAHSLFLSTENWFAFSLRRFAFELIIIKRILVTNCLDSLILSGRQTCTVRNNFSPLIMIDG